MNLRITTVFISGFALSCSSLEDQNLSEVKHHPSSECVVSPQTDFAIFARQSVRNAVQNAYADETRLANILELGREVDHRYQLVFEDMKRADPDVAAAFEGCEDNRDAFQFSLIAPPSQPLAGIVLNLNNGFAIQYHQQHPTGKVEKVSLVRQKLDGVSANLFADGGVIQSTALLADLVDGNVVRLLATPHEGAADSADDCDRCIAYDLYSTKPSIFLGNSPLSESLPEELPDTNDMGFGSDNVSITHEHADPKKTKLFVSYHGYGLAGYMYPERVEVDYYFRSGEDGPELIRASVVDMDVSLYRQ